eukprot:GCRY01000998.1.p1 GENE.GCRY01000998.1~~GCRY01000998.1.p1  ORF type:complete len:392 (+),score=84.68 GCRY01000998.1:70-1245(+)
MEGGIMPTPSVEDRIKRTIYVGQIDSAISEMEFVHFFQCLGEIVKFKLAGDGKQSWRFGFLEFKDEGAAKLALERMNGALLGNSPLKIGLSKNVINDGIFVSEMNKYGLNPPPPQQHFSFNTSKVNPEPFFAGYPSPYKMEIQPPHESFHPYRREMPMSRDERKELLKRRTVFLGGFDKRCREQHIRGLLSFAGYVTRVKMSTQNDKNFALVQFASEQDAQNSFHLDGVNIGIGKLKVSWAKGPISGEENDGDISSYSPEDLASLVRTVYVRNVDASVPREELERFFAENAGPLTRIFEGAVTNNAAQKFLFIEFKESADAAWAISLSGCRLGDSHIHVSAARKPMRKGDDVSDEAARAVASLDKLGAPERMFGQPMAVEQAAPMGFQTSV